jgi:hypothetical protein
MKGPGMRLDLDVRRVWRCPSCGRETRSEGQAVSRVCGCTKEGVAMQLVERPRPKPTIRLPESPAADPDIPVLPDFPTDIPVNPVVKRPLAENPELQGPEPTDNETGSTDSGL